jgi:hypothetical protein
MKKLKNVTRYSTTVSSNEDIINRVTHGIPYNPATNVYRVVGSSKTRREASKWIDFVASQTENTLQKSVNYEYSAPGVFTGTRITSTKLCTCVTTTLNPKRTPCVKCK